ncbi:TIGR01459 family HAD-type hydrolase [Methylovirgula sp. 4M-Z18]|uniref:TIGR01459 family HAD-type hydrolase n=1 Tax=Methylovirgula sp. 4M-Z18 TaxID=2293567 RepID=UPI000E2FE785|nr:TIGR01459 family HAD-type hydrolase [Methylovirgula sp. 4M-Z18]RFB79031.1 TIGR01459 family HAD-type hydrolase [Methylovirgula sp. 4M-Z18]
MHARPLFQTIASAFDYFLFDQYGVLHNGRTPYPGAAQALARLKQRGARIVILSNSGRSGAYNAERMATLGIARELYDDFVTSGDVAAAMLRNSEVPVPLTRATRCLVIGSSPDDGFARELGMSDTDDGAAADLVIITGSQSPRIAMNAYADRLRPAAERQVACLCSNPDQLMLVGDATYPGAGEIADLYERLGGTVVRIGKPFPAIYTEAAQRLSAPRPADILCVGDSVEHDVAGAHRFGAFAALVRTGILADLSEQELAKECAACGHVPDFIVSGLDA